MEDESYISFELTKVKRASGPFIERRTYKCSCGHVTTEIVQHLLRDHHLTITQISRIAGRVQQQSKKK